MWKDSDLIAAEGCAMCDNCGWMLEPSAAEIESAAGTAAFDALLGIKLAWKPSEWFTAILSKRAETIKAWHDGVVKANDEWEERKSKSKKPCPDCDDTGRVVNLFKDGEYSRCHCGK